MLHMIHIVVAGGLVGSAIYAYSTKYETIDYQEQVVKLEKKIQDEQEAIRWLKAEWSYLVAPHRIERLANLYLPESALLSLKQIVKLSDLPPVGSGAARSTAQTQSSQALEQLIQEGRTEKNLNLLR